MTDNELAQPHETVSNEPGILRILLEQYRLYEAKHHPQPSHVEGESLIVVPKAHTVADVYKCLHQGEFGIGHSIDDPMRFGQMLVRDLQLAQPNAEEPILEDVSFDASVFRLNLRPYRGRFPADESRASALLLDVCLESAMIHRGHDERFLGILAEFRNLNRSGSLCVDGTVYAFYRCAGRSFSPGSYGLHREMGTHSGVEPFLGLSQVQRSLVPSGRSRGPGTFRSCFYFGRVDMNISAQHELPSSGLLLQPPPGDLTGPYPALPYLKSYAEQCGHKVKVRDLGIESLSFLTEESTLSLVLARAEDLKRELEAKRSLEPLEQRQYQLLISVAAIGGNPQVISHAMKVFKDRHRFYHYPLYKQACTCPECLVPIAVRSSLSYRGDPFRIPHGTDAEFHREHLATSRQNVESLY